MRNPSRLASVFKCLIGPRPLPLFSAGSHTLSLRGQTSVPVFNFLCQTLMVFRSAVTWGSPAGPPYAISSSGLDLLKLAPFPRAFLALAPTSFIRAIDMPPTSAPYRPTLYRDLTILAFIPIPEGLAQPDGNSQDAGTCLMPTA
eukprot:5084804-Amphidinium_carterae.1